MIKVKENQPKEFVHKRKITVENVKIVNGEFVDEDGNIVERVLDQLVDSEDFFTIKITVELPEE